MSDHYILENLISGGPVHVRPPYGKIWEDKTVTFENCGIQWNMNDPAPRIPGCDAENGRRRYLAIERSDIRFTADPSEVDYSRKIFPKDSQLFKFLTSGEAALIY